MPKVRSFMDMKEKYEVKYRGDIVTARLTAVAEIKNSRYEAASSVIYNAIETARDILSTEGVPTGQWAPYIAFAEILAKLTFSHKNLTLLKEVSGVKAYFVTAHSCDAKILDKIVQAIIGTVPPY